MADQTSVELQRNIDAAWATLIGQLQGMDAHLDRADAPGEWTTREVLSHLLFESGFDPATVLRTFAERDYPLIEIKPGDTHLDEHRRRMTLTQLTEALDVQRRSVLAYLRSLDEPGLTRKGRIPLFKQFMGTDEVTIALYVGALFDLHWNDHAGQLAKIRRAAGLAAIGPGVKSSGVPI
jgi:hypothetical protein